ncbi:unnamed protein product [Echinostoma caproni]|uniref:DAZ-associated protein 2 n=1 Tax=Echinostoma caproni TaxID=27848 RepID=A0A183AZ36_9TREM|nr:unnamed protein product [Echinostoma caproni]
MHAAPPPYSPPEGPIPSAPYAYTAPTSVAPPYPGSHAPYPVAGATPGQAPQIGFVIPTSAAPTYTSYNVPPRRRGSQNQCQGNSVDCVLAIEAIQESLNRLAIEVTRYLVCHLHLQSAQCCR